MTCGIDERIARLRESSLSLPERLRERLREPFGKVCQTSEMQDEIGGAEPIVAVGDMVAITLLEMGIVPLISILDLKTKRHTEMGEEAKAAIAKAGLEQAHLRNEPATIASELWGVIEERLAGDVPCAVIVDGEEDLAALPAIVLAPDGARVLYGLPGQGAVVVKIDTEKKKEVLDILEEMEKLD